MNASSLPPTLAKRTAHLKGLHERLRTTHFGIDTEIQRLLDAFAPWYQFAETQTRPRTIGLWGMTGTGKSSLVRALVKEAGLEDRTFWLDAGESTKEYWLENVFNLMDEHLDGCPFILVVDEFQHARTVQKGEEVVEPGMLRRFWELIDTGRVVTWPNFWRMKTLKDFRGCFKKALDAGVTVQNGRVVTGTETFRELVGTHYRDPKQDTWGIPSDVWDDLRDMYPSPKPSLADFESKLSTLNGIGILEWLDELDRNAQRACVIDASRILVVLLGNLDELYVGGKEPMAELDPEVLLHRHHDIGRAGVQHALLKLFRIEQVGRIGSSHVVFPPIGKHTIDAIVQQEVRGLCGRLSAHCGRPIEVEQGLVDHLRATSSIAVLGARPVVEAVQNTVPLLLSQVLEYPAAADAKAIRLGISASGPVAELDLGGHKRRVELSWNAPAAHTHAASDSRLERAAFHEAGHLLCGVLLRGRRPLQACVRTRDPQVAGFVAWDIPPEQPFLRSEIIPELAVMLGGRVAEQLHYGPEEVSAGVENDLRKATGLALDMAKREGMGAGTLHYAEHRTANSGGFRTLLPEAEAQAKQWIEAAEALAFDTLKKNKALLDRCVEALKEKGSLGMKELGMLLVHENGTARMYLEAISKMPFGLREGLLRPCFVTEDLTEFPTMLGFRASSGRQILPARNEKQF